MGNKYTKEITIKGSPEPIAGEQMKKFLSQMNKSICKIKIGDNLGTGFFCLIPFPDQLNTLPVLITCNHVLNGNNISIGKQIDISLNNEKKKFKISIDKLRKTYTDENLDVTIIEIRVKDYEEGTIDFLNIDHTSFNNKSEELYKNNKLIYIIHYLDGEKMSCSMGEIKNDNYNRIDKDNNSNKFNNNFFNHSCSTEKGSSGAPIISFLDFNVLGIHKGYNMEEKLNFGIKIRIPIENFIEQYGIKNSFNLKNNSLILNDNYANKDIVIKTEPDKIILDNKKYYYNVISYKKENGIKLDPDSLSLYQIEQALFQMKNCVCKIKYKDMVGTGFFCKIGSKNSFNLIPTLITCYNVLGKTIIKKKKIDISLNNSLS